MNISDIELPSNRKFGFFFSGVFIAVSGYFYFGERLAVAYSLAAIGVLFLAVTLIKADILLPLNKLWMRFGLLLGMVVSPIVMGVIFFGLFAPISLMMRLFGRDELRLRFKQKKSHWIPRDTANTQTDSFKNQF
jgi:hypothetical protein